MPLFHFDVSDGSREPDRTGQELATLQEARVHAVHHACSVVEEQPERLRNQELRIEVSDGQGLLLFTLILLGVESAAAAGMA